MDEIVIEEEELLSSENDYQRMSLKELNTQLEQAVNNEDYELAAKIRDEISKRN